MLIILKILRAPPFDFRGIFTRLQFSKLNTYLDFVIFRYLSGFCQISIPIWILSNFNTHLDFVKVQYPYGFCQISILIWILSNFNAHLDFVKMAYPSCFGFFTPRFRVFRRVTLNIFCQSLLYQLLSGNERIVKSSFGFPNIFQVRS